MNQTAQKSSTRLIVKGLFVLMLIGLAACTGNNTAESEAPVDATQAFENALLTATYSVAAVEPTQTPTIPPTEAPPTETPPAPSETPDPNRTPPALPEQFQSGYLNPLDTPHTYIEDTCEYLKAKWDPNNSKPGTVVMPIMFHGVTEGEVDKPYQISHEDLEKIFRDLTAQGFESITIDQLNDFLYNNAKIPIRSVILIIDDRHYGEYYEKHYKAMFEEYGWTVVNGFISDPETLNQIVLQENVALQNEGWVDHQAHGVIHNVPIERNTSEDYMRSELFGSVTYIEEYFGKKPIAYIWPGGGFNERAVQLAREAGYTLGFSVNPRGPLMYNWIPLADSNDDARPSFQAEGYVGDPLMVLPRYWDQDSRQYLDTVRTIGKDANTYAMQNKAVELEYYDIVCKPITGEIPQANP